MALFHRIGPLASLATGLFGTVALMGLLGFALCKLL